MQKSGHTNKSDEADEFYSEEMTGSGKKVYSVVIEGVESQIETLDSFAIKFGLLSNIPVTKIKYIVKTIPAVIWTGSSKSRAKGLLSLIVEAGGKGKIEVKSQRPAKVPEIEAREVKRLGGRMCHKCGFPIGEKDEFCQFCMSPVGEVHKKPHKKDKEQKSSKFPVPPARLLFYMFFLLAGLIVIQVL